MTLAVDWAIKPHTNKQTNGLCQANLGERGGSVVECRTPAREVGGSKPTAAVLCP